MRFASLHLPDCAYHSGDHGNDNLREEDHFDFGVGAAHEFRRFVTRRFIVHLDGGLVTSVEYYPNDRRSVAK